MEKCEAHVPQPVDFSVGSYTIRAALDDRKIAVRAYSEITSKFFEGVLQIDDLTAEERFVFEDCAEVYSMIEECLAEKREIRLDDAGVITFQYFNQSNKKNQKEKWFQIRLKEIELGENQRLAIKVGKQELEIHELKERQKQAEAETERLRSKLEATANQLKLLQENLSFEKIVPELNTTTASIAKATINGNQISTNKGPNEWNPFFLTCKLERRQFFEIEIVDIGKDHFIVGIAADTLLNAASSHSNVDSLVLYLQKSSTMLYYEGKSLKVLPTVDTQTGMKIRVGVDMQAGVVEWTQLHPVRQFIVREMIPPAMRGKTLLPVVYLVCDYNNVVKYI